jgi:pimeloyl-ACP methyl ester carboxylesterase
MEDEISAHEHRRHVPLLLVHGAWHGSWCWNEHWTDHLTDAGFEVRAITLPGHHQQGSHKRIWPSMGKYVRKVRAHLDEMGPGTVLVGHSMGGLVVQKALERQLHARGAVLLASTPRSGVAALVFRLFKAAPARTMRMITTLNLWPAVSSEDLVRERLFCDDTPEDTVADTFALLQNESYRAFTSMLFRRAVPRRIYVPVRVYAAEHDGLFTIAEQEKLAATYGTPLQIVEGSGHNLMLDTKWRETADRVIESIDQL